MTTILIFLTFLCFLGTLIWMHSKSTQTSKTNSELLMSNKRQTETASRESSERTERLFDKMIESNQEILREQSKLLDRVLMGPTPLVQDQPPTISNEQPDPDSLSFEEEWQRLEPRVQGQLAREEAEEIWGKAPVEEGISPLEHFDPRAAVIDPTKTPEEGSVLWSPSSSETAG